MLTANVEPVVKTTNLNLQFSVSPRPTAPLVSPKTYCTDYNEISADNGQNHENIGFFGLRPGRYRHSDYLAGRGIDYTLLIIILGHFFFRIRY
jgi:hypothetical protein